MLKLTYFFNRGRKKQYNVNSKLYKLERKVNMLCSTVYGSRNATKNELKEPSHRHNLKGADGRFICKAN